MIFNTGLTHLGSETSNCFFHLWNKNIKDKEKSINNLFFFLFIIKEVLLYMLGLQVEENSGKEKYYHLVSMVQLMIGIVVLET